MKRLLCILMALILVISLLSSVFAESLVPNITKNPSSEAIAIGGKTWFIAHADNATSMNWELVDPDGYIYTLSDAMALNPGLSLEALEGDTIAVSIVPVSMNGWSVQATFYGAGGAVSTSPAYIYVGDFLTAYSSAIEKYRIAKNAGNINPYEYDVSEWITSCDHVGYALKDLDKNGIPELLIGGIGAKYNENNVIFELFTLENNTPVQLLTSWGRSRKYLMYDNRIYEEGSSGAAYSALDLYKVAGSYLVFDEGYATYRTDDYENAGTAIYHYSTAESTPNERIYFGDYTKPDAVYSTDNLYPLYEQFQAQCWMPQLTQIA